MARPKGARDAAYEDKRRLLLRKIAARLGQINRTHPSLRQLAAAAEVTVPTLRHYFGGRDEIVESVLAHYRELGEPFLRDAAQPHGRFDESIREFLQALSMGMSRGRLGDVFAVGFVEGLMNDRLGPACLAELVDPALDALAARLAEHQARGEMRPGDARHAALMLIAPVVVGWHHQEQMFGKATRPLALPAFMDDLAKAFVTAHRALPADEAAQTAAS